MTRFLLAATPALFLAGFGLQAQSLQVTGVRTWSFPGITRVAVEVNGEFSFRSDRAHDPERIFFDIVGAAPRFHGKRLWKQDLNDPLVKRVRIAETEPDVTRVVLDLTGPAEFTASKLSSPDRLIVELKGPAKSAPPAVTVPSATPPSVISRSSGVSIPAPPAQTLVATVAANHPVPAPALSATDTASAAHALSSVPGDPLRTDSNATRARIADLPSPPPIRARSADVSVASSLTRALGLKVNRVVIDAGHGGHDQGTSGPAGLLEKDLVLDVALRLGRLVEQRMGAEVVYTRKDDTFIPLEERTAIANRSHADLFLSIHANSSVATDVAGIETYYLNFTNSPDAMNVAARENAASDKSVFELKDLIQKISLHDKLEESKQFAGCIQTALQNFNLRSFPSARNRGVRKAPFVVLIGASMPSVLTEIGFLTNPRQERLLSKPEYREKLAEAIYRGISNYTDTLSHFDAPKQARAFVSAGSPATSTR